MTAQCFGWLAADFLVRAGFTVTTTPGGRRVASRAGLRAEDIGPVCAHEDCQVPLGLPLPVREPVVVGEVPW